MARVSFAAGLLMVALGLTAHNLVEGLTISSEGCGDIVCEELKCRSGSHPSVESGGCCQVCNKLEGQQCGGMWGMDGQCRKGLICKVDEEEQNKLPAGNEATGTCQRKPREKKTGGSESKFGKKLIGEKKRKFEKKPKLPKKPQITHPTTVGGGNKLPLKWENLLKDGVVTTKLRSELSKLFIKIKELFNFV